MPIKRTWEVVIVPDPTTPGATLITATETVPGAEPITHYVGGITGQTQHDAVDDFVVKVLGLERPFSTVRQFAGYWCAVYTIEQPVDQSAWLCGFCREAFSNASHRDYHEANICPLRPTS